MCWSIASLLGEYARCSLFGFSGRLDCFFKARGYVETDRIGRD